jgi:hypothetical protein
VGCPAYWRAQVYGLEIFVRVKTGKYRVSLRRHGFRIVAELLMSEKEIEALQTAKQWTDPTNKAVHHFPTVERREPSPGLIWYEVLVD